VADWTSRATASKTVAVRVGGRVTCWHVLRKWEHRVRPACVRRPTPRHVDSDATPHSGGGLEEIVSRALVSGAHAGCPLRCNMALYAFHGHGPMAADREPAHPRRHAVPQAAQRRVQTAQEAEKQLSPLFPRSRCCPGKVGVDGRR